MIDYLSSTTNTNKFMTETKASEQEAEEYLKEFKGNVGQAVAAFNERTVEINSFAEKFKISVI